MDLQITEDTVVGTTAIKVVGCGGGGSNAVNRMMEVGVQGVQFIAANTDLQALNDSRVPFKIPLGRQVTKGLGAGGVPEIGEKAAEEDKETIENVLKGADMVFLTAGMGGGTGTGAAPVIARIAKEMGCLTVAVVTRPFAFERQKKMDLAEAGIRKLREHVDTLIIIPNEKILNIIDKNTSIPQALLMADELLQMGVQGISEIITRSGTINIDFADVRTVMKGQGDALLGIGHATGDNKGIDAAVKALENPLLDDVKIGGAKGLLVNIKAGEDFTMEEYGEVMTYITSQVDNDAMVISGQYTDENLQDEVSITVIATGFGEEQLQKAKQDAEDVEKDQAKDTGSDVLSYQEWNEISTGRGVTASIPPDDTDDMSTIKTGLSGGGTPDLFSVDVDDLKIPTYLRNKMAGVENGNKTTGH